MTGVLGPAGRSLRRQLRELGVDVIGVDMAIDPGSDHTFRRIPAATDRDFVPELLRVAHEEGVDLLIPTVSEELPVLGILAATRHHPVAPPLRIQIASPVAIAIADDKWLTYRALAQAGVPVPRSALPSAMERELHALRDATLLTKPRIGRGGRGISLHRGLPGGLSGEPLSDSVIVQEFVPGTEYAPNLFLSATEEVVVVLEKTTLAHGTTGNAVEVRRLAADAAPDVADLAVRAALALALTGPVDLDIRRRADGVPVVLEVNARFGTNSAYAPEILEAVLHEHSFASARPVAVGAGVVSRGGEALTGSRLA